MPATNDTKTVLICGVGGQGALLAADILARCAVAAGDDVKLSEIHGMAQRGGAVTTIVRIGSHVNSMVADLGDVDFLVSFEKTEALRNIAYLKKGGAAFVNDQSIKPMSVLSGRADMPENVNDQLKHVGAVVVPAELIARQAGTSKAANIALLGALSTALPYTVDSFHSVIAQRVPEKFKDVNLAAFDAGRAYAVEHSA
jgi:indolepyruvate ferredoxin oxidoreductase beta subunit